MLLLIDNYDSFTFNLVQRFGEIDRGLRVEVVRNDRIDITGAEAMKPTHLVISPGPCTPKESGISPDVITRFMGRIPILGVCLGHQTMADCHGMTVTRHVIPMHGKTSLVHHNSRGVFAGMPDPFVATRYHSLVVLPETVPERRAGEDGWEISAWTDETDEKTGAVRRVVMGLRRVWADPRKKPVEGVQFHPESFLTVDGPQLLGNFLNMK